MDICKKYLDREEIVGEFYQTKQIKQSLELKN